MPFLHGTDLLSKTIFKGVLCSNDHYETFTSLFYFCTRIFLELRLRLYLNFENLGFLTKSWFFRGGVQGGFRGQTSKKILFCNFLLFWPYFKQGTLLLSAKKKSFNTNFWKLRISIKYGIFDNIQFLKFWDLKF